MSVAKKDKSSCGVHVDIAVSATAATAAASTELRTEAIIMIVTVPPPVYDDASGHWTYEPSICWEQNAP